MTSPPRFSFRTRWRLPAPPERVFAALSDIYRVGSWWPDFEDVTPMGTDAIRARLRGALGTRFSVVLRISRRVFPSRIEIACAGDLAGAGVFTLTGDAHGSRVDYTWDVTLHRPVLGALAPLLRPVLRRSHDAVMRRGERGLRAYLESDSPYASVRSHPSEA